jgi:hypothetical protein
LLHQCSLTRCLVEQQTAGDGGVEAFNVAGHGDGDAVGSGGEKGIAEACAFVADEQGAWAGERGFADGCAFASDGGDGGDVVLREQCEGFGFVRGK